MKKQCDITDLGSSQCGENERCRFNQNSQQGICDCQIYFHSVNGKCVTIPSGPVDVGTTVSITSKPQLQTESGGMCISWSVLLK